MSTTRKAIYMGPRLKRLRRQLGMTQANMAADLEVSSSYIALLERNQRPVTADLLLKLAATYKIDIADLAEGADEEQGARLRTVLKDAIFADIDLPSIDVADIATSFPGFAEAMLRLYTAFTEERLALAERQEGSVPQTAQGSSDPVAEARAFLVARGNCFPSLDDSAAALAGELTGIEPMIARLAERHGLEVRFADAQLLFGAMRWYDYHRRRVLLNEHLGPAARRFQLALQLAYLEQDTAIAELLAEGRLKGENARMLVRRALVGYWAAALLMPYRPFLEAARRSGYDVEALASEFGVSFEQAAHRLTTLQRPGEEGVPFFFLRVDRAGNISKRLDGAGFPFARHGGACPLWNVHATFERPGRILTQRLELPDGERFFSIARTVTAGGGNHTAPRVTRSVALACAEKHADKLVYGNDPEAKDPVPIGVACRLCHRPRCMARSAPPIGSELRPDDYRETAIPFDFAPD